MTPKIGLWVEKIAKNGPFWRNGKAKRYNELAQHQGISMNSQKGIVGVYMIRFMLSSSESLPEQAFSGSRGTISSESISRRMESSIPIQKGYKNE
jgi:hypothetical protein